jgi:integrase
VAKQYVNLNRKDIQALPSPPAGKRATYYLRSARRNEQIPAGFVVRVTPSGQKTLCVQRRVHGAQRRILVCRFGDMPLDEALSEAWRITADIAKDRDPEADKRAAREAREAAQTTIADYWKGYDARHVERLSPRTRVLYRGLAETYILPRLGNVALSAVTRGMVARFHDEITVEIVANLRKRNRTGDGGRTANIAVNLLRSMFNDAIDREVVTTANPAQRIKKAKETRRERFLSLEEIGRLYQALEADAQERADWTWSDLFRLLLSTGARRGNVLAMRWEDVALQDRVWRIPADQTKTGTTYVVALEPGAVEILTRRRAEAAQLAEIENRKLNPWVFPGRGKRGHLSEVKSAWDRIRKQAGLDGVRVNDLRHTHASLLASRGVSLQMIGAQLGHRSTTTTARYAHLIQEQVQQAVEGAFNAINGGGDDSEGGA